MTISWVNKIKFVAISAALTSAAISVSVQSAVSIDTSALREAVTVEGVRSHQAALQAAADDNGGVREASSPGSGSFAKLSSNSSTSGPRQKPL